MNISILGAGAYGIALATVLGKKNNINIWTKFEDERDQILNTRENKKLLPGVKLDTNINVTCSLSQAIENSKIIYLAIPMFALREVVVKLSKIIKEDQILCITSKGVEEHTGMFPSQVIEDVFDFKNIAMISGPSFAIELASGAETGFVVASKDKEISKLIKESIESKEIIVEITDDILGIQILATIKNIYAILLGMLNGIKVYESTKASVLKCIINDCRNILEKLGGKRASAYSFAGLGDLLLTCISDKSRNFSFGKEFVKTHSIVDSLKNINTTTVEGLYSLDVIYKLLKDRNININSINYIYDILYNNKNIENILKDLN